MLIAYTIVRHPACYEKAECYRPYHVKKSGFDVFTEDFVSL
jgi:hypothetical protein